MPTAQTRSTRPESTKASEGGAGSGDSGAEPLGHAMASVFDPFLKQSEFQWWGSGNLNAMTDMATASIHGTMQLIGEATRFMNERLHHDMETAKTLAACKTGEDVFRTQSAFFDAALRSYADETAKMVHLAADATQAAFRPVEDRTRETLHSLARIPRDNGMFV